MKKFQSGKIEIRGNKKKELKEGSTDDGGGGIVVGVVDGGGGGSGVDGVEDVERAVDEGRWRVEIVMLHGNPSTHLRELGKWNSQFSQSRWVGS